MAEEPWTILSRNVIKMNAFETLTITSVLILTALGFYWILRRHKYKLPPGPIGLPILGYLPFLGPEPHKDLDQLKHTYGNVFSLYMGRSYTVILADYEALKDAFSQLNQPSTLFKSPRGFDSIPDGLGFSVQNGREWVEQRRFCVKSMKEHGVGRERWESIIQHEVSDLTKFISSSSGEPINICEMLSSSISNNISTFILGRRFSVNSPERKFLDVAIDEIINSFSQTGIFGIFPFLRHICIKLGLGKVKDTHNTMLKFNEFMRKEVEKIRTYREMEHESLIGDYIQEMNSTKAEEHYFNDTNLLGNIQGIFIGGSETSRTSIYWLILVMAVYPAIQSKVHQEIDAVLQHDEKIQWSDRKRLPYTMAVIMEGQRWRTLVPLNPPRMATKDIKIQGYDIPKGTYIAINIYGLHHDTRYWKNPEIFNPERFLTEDGKDIITKPESYCPFSYGKRNCPGGIIAMMEILIYFTELMQKFTVSPVKGKKIDMNGYLGLTHQAYPQELNFVPR